MDWIILIVMILLNAVLTVLYILSLRQSSKAKLENVELKAKIDYDWGTHKAHTLSVLDSIKLQIDAPKPDIVTIHFLLNLIRQSFTVSSGSNPESESDSGTEPKPTKEVRF